MIGQMLAGISTHSSTAGMAAVGVIALWAAFKVVKLIFKLFFGLLAIGLLGGAAWWFLQTH